MHADDLNPPSPSPPSPPSSGPPSIHIHFDSITKRFSGVLALDAVSLSVRRGECHGLMGENGAGKSTLGKILAGIHRPDSGRVVLSGRARRFASPADAARAGIGMVHQELAFCPNLSVGENLCLGRYPRRLGVILDRRALVREANLMLERIGVALDPRSAMHTLSVAQEQLVQIAFAVGTGARILVFDEPTSSLSEHEAQQLFALIRSLRAQGITIIYVSHRIPEVLDLSDRISVLRDGRFVGTLEKDQGSSALGDRLVHLMIGRSVQAYFPRHVESPPGDVMLRVRGLRSPGRFGDIDLDVRAGEIVGLGGLMGSGRSEVAQAIFGLDRAARGSILVRGEPMAPGSPRRALALGLGYVPEDRNRQGLVPQMSARANISLLILDRLKRLGLLDHGRERRVAEGFFRRLGIKAPSVETPVMLLSGGNQQKVLLARWLAARARILLVDEPTRGVDVGAKAQIHGLIDELAKQGAAILLISSELPELLNLSSRILVLREGRLVGELNRTEATQSRVLHLMAGRRWPPLPPVLTIPPLTHP